MKIISVVSAKGGVGRTTISANLCAVLRDQGHTVVALDLDQQNSLRLHFGDAPNNGRGIAQHSCAGIHWTDAIVQSKPGCFVLPFGQAGEIERSGFESQLSSNPLLISQQLQTLGLPMDTIVVIDTPSVPSVYLKQALSIANMVVVVSLLDAASYAVIPRMVRLIEHYCLTRDDFTDYLYVLNQLDRSRQLVCDVADIMASQYAQQEIAVIHQDQSIPEALAFGQDAMKYAPASRAAYDFIDLANQIKAMVGIENRAVKHGVSF